MNPDQPSREEIEAKLTALLLGELPDEEARLLRWAIAQDAELGQLHDRLKLAIGLVRQVMVKPTESIPLKLSDERRKKLLAHFKTPRPKPSFWLKRIEVPSLIPVLVAVAIIALLAAMLLPALSKAKSKAQHLTLLSAQRMAMESGAENAASAPIVAAPTASAPAAVAFAPEPVLAPPPVQIVLPQPESTPDDAAQTGLPAGSGNGGVYSQKIIGYANNQLPSPPPAALPPGGVALPAVEAESGQLAFDHRETAQRNAGFQQRLEIVEKQVQMPAHAVDSSSTVREPNGGNVQNAGVVNAFAGAGGFGGFGGGGGAGGIGGSIPAQQPARMIRNGAVDQLGVEPPPPALNSLNSTTLAWSGSDVNRSPAANQPDAAGHGFSLLGPVTGSEVLQPPPGGSLSEHFPRPASPGTADTTFALRAPATAAAPLGKFPETASDEFAGEISTDKKLKLPAGQPGQSASIVRAPSRSRATQTLAASDGLDFDDRVALPSGGQRANRYLTPAQPADANKVPLAGDVPVLGSLFQNSTPANTVAAGSPPTAEMKLGDRDQDVDAFKLNNAEPQQTAEALQNVFQTTADSSSQQSALQSRAQTIALPVAAPAQIVTTNTVALNAGSFYSFYSGFSPTPTLEAEQLQTINQQQIEKQQLYKEQLAQLQELKSIQQNKPEKLREVLPLMVQDGTLNGMLGKLNQTQDQSLKNELNREIDDRVTGIMSGLESQVDTKKAELDSLAEKQKKTQGTEHADLPILKPTANAPIPQPEIQTSDNAFSTFSLNVSDVSFKLAAASLENGRMPDAASIRSEEFINAFDYRDPAAAAGQPVAFTSERARYPFAQNRDLLRFSIKTAAAGRAADRPLNLVLLLDNSGSMERADRVAIIREALRILATQLHPQDTVSVVTFARTARLWVDGVSGDKAGEVFDQVGGLTPQGGTNLEEAMRLAYETARRHYLASGMNRVVLLTDGAANLGNVDPGALKQKVEAQRKQGIALDCFGIGWEGYNDDLLEQLSGNGDGRYAFINTPEEAGTEFAAKLAGALQVAAKDVKVQVEFNPQRVISWRQIGYATHQLTKEQFRDNSVIAAEIAAQEAGNALYTVELKPDGDGPVATVRVRYKIPGTTDIREHGWDVPYAGKAVSLGQSSAAMRLAATAGAFSEWLAASPFAQEVSPDELLKTISGVPEIYGADQRPKKLEWMIRQAKSLSGK